jgi:hypothetical protein
MNGTEPPGTNDVATKSGASIVGIATQEWLDQIEVSIPSQDQPKISKGLSPEKLQSGNFSSIGSRHDAGKMGLARSVDRSLQTLR